MRLPMNRAVLIAVMSVLIGASGGRPASAGQPLILAQADDDTVGAPPIDDQSSAAAMTVRIDRLESSIRSLTGQVEQLQFQNRKLTDDLRKMQEDVDFRLQDIEKGGVRPAGAPARRSDASPPVGGSEGLPQDASGVDVPAASVAAAPAVAAPVRTSRRSGDAFDPSANPDAPGAPRQLGTSAPSAPLPRRDNAAGVGQPSAPLDLMKHADQPPAADQSTENGVAALRTTPAAPDALPAAPNASAVASLAPGGTRDDFNGNLDLYRQGQLDSAATGFKSFLDKYPRDRLVPDAVYYLGETYTKLGRHREAAEQYLRLSTDFSKAPRAPDALLRLGMELNAMGVREQACATYQEVTRRYPTASTDVRAGVDRELKRARC